MQNGRLVVLVDVDGTVADFHRDWFGIYSKLSGEHFTKDMATKWDVFSLVSHPEMMEKALHAPGLYRNLELFPGVLETLRELQGICEFKIVSATPEFAQADRSAWVKEVFDDLVSEVIYTQDKHLVPGHVLIDDNEEWVSRFPGLRVLMDQRWNRSAHRSKYDVRVRNWLGNIRSTLKDFYREKLAACA